MVTCQKFDVLHGQQIYKYTLQDKISVDVVTCGATLVAIRVPNAQGTLTDVLLGLNSSADIISSPAYMGSIVGRCANRIAGGKFQLDGKNYQLACNNGKNHLHGGKRGFNQKVFDSKVEEDTLVLSCSAADGEENYPANMHLTVKYTVKGSSLLIEYIAQSDGVTLCNPTNHAYFNLNGDGDILEHELRIFADKFLPVDENLIPTGEERCVNGTPFDFTKPKPIGKDIFCDDGQLKLAGGYDHNFCLSSLLAAQAYSPKTGIVLDCVTDMPGLQLYTGNFLAGECGKARYTRHSGFCLETQFYPDAINHPQWKQPVLRDGVFRSSTEYRFSVRK